MMSKEPCTECGGNGYRLCDYCIAMGKPYIEKNFGVCPKCNGADVYKCEACEGTGAKEYEANDDD